MSCGTGGHIHRIAHLLKVRECDVRYVGCMFGCVEVRWSENVCVHVCRDVYLYVNVYENGYGYMYEHA